MHGYPSHVLFQTHPRIRLQGFKIHSNLDPTIELTVIEILYNKAEKYTNLLHVPLDLFFLGVHLEAYVAYPVPHKIRS